LLPVLRAVDVSITRWDKNEGRGGKSVRLRERKRGGVGRRLLVKRPICLRAHAAQIKRRATAGLICRLWLLTARKWIFALRAVYRYALWGQSAYGSLTFIRLQALTTITWRRSRKTGIPPHVHLHERYTGTVLQWDIMQEICSRTAKDHPWCPDWWWAMDVAWWLVSLIMVMQQ